MLPLGCAELAIGIVDLVMARTVPGIVSLILGIDFITIGVLFFVAVRQLRRELAKADEAGGAAL